jgi:Protein of unknown function (DUF1580)
MPIDPSKEQIISLTAAAKTLPRLRNNRPVSPATIWRWYKAGIRGVKLETIIVGGVRATSVEALARFMASINGQPTLSHAADQEQLQAQIERELDRMGA